jgi:hypothetical protein
MPGDIADHGFSAVGERLAVNQERLQRPEQLFGTV